MNLRTLHRYLRLTPFDASTEHGRSNERYRLAALSMAANVLSRGFAMVVMVLTVSLTIPYLGAERFGVWMTIASFVAMLSFLDLGVGNALTNKVSQAATENNPQVLQRTVSGGLGFLLVLGCVVGVLLLVLTTLLPWHKIIKLESATVGAEVLQTVAVFSILFGFSLFSTGIQRVFSGLQRAFEAHLVSFAGSVLSLLALWFVSQAEAGIPFLLGATFGVQSLANLFLLLILARRGLFTFHKIGENTRLQAHHLLRVGGLFFILQIGTMVGWGADSLIIASTLGATQVAVFAIVQRLFQFVTQPLSMLNAPLWGAYADAHARGEKSFIRKTLKWSLRASSFVAFAGAVLLFFVGESLVKLWTGNAIPIPVLFLLAYGVWAIADSVGNALGMFLNGCNIVKPQVLTVIVFSVFSLPLKYLLVKNYGIAAMVIGQACIYTVITYLSYGVLFRRELRQIYV